MTSPLFFSSSQREVKVNYVLDSDIFLLNKKDRRRSYLSKFLRERDKKNSSRVLLNSAVVVISKK